MALTSAGPVVQAPKVWEAMKPVRDTLIGEAVKKALGLG
jgi:hypothetical protein